MTIRRIPIYSSCCNAPVLGDSNNRRLYCYGCNRTVMSFAGGRRERAMKAVRVVRRRLHIQVMLCGHVLGYARDVPNLVWHGGSYRKVGRSTYKYFVQGSALVSALGFEQCKGEGGFRSLNQAWQRMSDYFGIPRQFDKPPVEKGKSNVRL